MKRVEGPFLLGFVLLAALVPVVVHNEYLLHIGIMILFSVVLAQSFNLIVGYVGEFPLGHIVFLGIGAYAAAIGTARFGLPMPCGLAGGALVAAVSGVGIGAITLRLRGPFFVIVTLCFAEVARLIANNWVGLTNGPMGIDGIRSPGWITAQPVLGQKLAYYYVALGLTVIALYVCYRFVNSVLGRGAITLRENRHVAQSIGIPPFRVALTTFVIGAGLAGLSGAFYAYYISFVGPEVFDFSLTASMIIMVLLGGKGTLAGSVVGPVVVVLLQEFLRDAKELRLSLFGAIVCAVVLFLPGGIMGFLHRVRERPIAAPEALRAASPEYS
jgi:branched-chain amino acid transport system permease protein